MRSNQIASKFCYSSPGGKSNLKFVNSAIKNFLHYLLACTCTPLLFGSLMVLPGNRSANATAPSQEIAQVETTQINTSQINTTQIDIAQVVSASQMNRPSLKLGSTGNAVNELQAALKLLGLYDGEVNGQFDNATAAAVSSFRQAAGLPAEGTVDNAVWQRLFPSTPANISTAPVAPVAPSQISSQLPPQSNRFPIPTQTQNSGNQNSNRIPTINPNQNTPNNNASNNNAPKTNASNNNSSSNIMSVVNSSPEPRPANPNRDSRSASQTQRSTTSTNVRTTNRNGTQRTTTSTRTTSTSSQGNQRRSTSSSSNRTTTRSSGSSSSRRRPVTLPKFEQKSNIQYTTEGEPILRVGMRGEEVAFLQQRLRRLGYLQNQPDGDFGAATESAVKALQQRFGLENDGVVGGATWDILLR